MKRLTYEAYAAEYAGNSPVPKERFGAYLRRAEAELGAMSRGRIVSASTPETAAAAAVLTEALYSAEHGGVASESNDGFSQTYTSEADVMKSAKKRVKAILAESDLLYSGVGKW